MTQIHRDFTLLGNELSDNEEGPHLTSDRSEVHQYQQNKDRARMPSSKRSKDKQPTNKDGLGNKPNPEEKKTSVTEEKIRKIAEEIVEEVIQKEISRLSRYKFWIIIAGIVLVCLVVLQFVWLLWKIKSNSGTLETLKTVSTCNEYSHFVKNEDYNKDKEKAKELFNDHEQAIMNKLSHFVTNADYNNDKEKEKELFEQQVSHKVEATKEQIQGSQEIYFSSMLIKWFGVGREKEVNLATLRDEVEHCKADFKMIEQSTSTLEIELKDNLHQLKVGLEDVKDSVSNTKGELNEELSHAMGKFADQLSQTKQKMSDEVEHCKANIKTIEQSTSTFVIELKDNIHQLKVGLYDVNDSVSNTKEKLNEELSHAMGEFADQLSQTKQKMKDEVEHCKANIKTLEQSTSTLEIELKDNIHQLKVSLEDVNDSVSNTKEKLNEELSNAMRKFADQLSQTKQKMSDEVEHCKANIKTIEQSTSTFEIELKDNIHQLKVGLYDVNDSVSNTKEKLNEELSHAMGEFADQLSQTKQKMKDEVEHCKANIKTLEQSTSTLEIELKDNIHQLKVSLEDVNDSVSNTKEKLNEELSNAMRKFADQLSQTKQKMSDEVEHCKANIKTIEQSTSTFEIELKDNIHQLKVGLYDVNDSVSNTKEKLNEELSHAMGEFADQLSQTKQKMKDEVEHCKANIKTLEQSTSTLEIELKDNIHQLKVSLEDVNDSVSNTKEKLNEELSNAMRKFADQLSQTKQKMMEDIGKMDTLHESRLNQAKAALDAQYDALNDQVSKSKVVVDEVLLPNAFNKEDVLGAFLLLLLLGIAMFFYLRKPSGQHDVPHHCYQEGFGSGSGKSEKSVSPAVARIPLNQPLQSAICVISFEKHTQALHRKVMMEQVLHGLPEELIRTVCPQFRLVVQHEDITRLPATKLYIMFVDYSERHVIIEEPGLGLGDTRRTTVQALERFGGELVIIYMYDMASRHLSSNRRYNRDIYCVKTQPTLKTLNERGRFFSIYETMNDFQRQNLQSIIQDVFSE